MEDRIKLSYFYGREADQYSFYRIPKLLFTEEYFQEDIRGGKSVIWSYAGSYVIIHENQWFDTEGTCLHILFAGGYHGCYGM